MNHITVLKPLVLNGKVIPHMYEDVNGGREPGFVRDYEYGKARYNHQSGYGYLPEHRVRIIEPKAS